LPVIMTRLGIEKIEGTCLLENPASCAVLEKCGFTLEFSGAGKYQGEIRDIRRFVYSHVEKMEK